MNKKQKKWMISLLKWIIILAVIITAYLFLDRAFDIKEKLRLALSWIDGLGLWGYLVFAVLYILATVLFIPGSILTLGAGFLFGVLKGSIIVSIASTLGATLAFIIGRYLARGAIIKKIDSHPQFKAIDDAIGREGWKIVFLTRLSPIFPFNLLNYGLGLTKVKLFPYILASWTGMIPGTVMYVYFGSLASDLATLGTESTPDTPLSWIFKILGLAAAVGVSVFIAVLAKKAINNKVHTTKQPIE